MSAGETEAQGGEVTSLVKQSGCLGVQGTSSRQVPVGLCGSGPRTKFIEHMPLTPVICAFPLLAWVWPPTLAPGWDQAGGQPWFLTHQPPDRGARCGEKKGCASQPGVVGGDITQLPRALGERRQRRLALRSQLKQLPRTQPGVPLDRARESLLQSGRRRWGRPSPTFGAELGQ